jgi:hypothetical protein
LQAGGRRFESDHLHQGITGKMRVSALFPVVGAAPLLPRTGAWFFVRVNQVLVRLWAHRVACLTGGSDCQQRERCSEAMCVHIPGLDPGMLSESDPCRNVLTDQ